MTENVNIQILEALGYWDAGPYRFSGIGDVRRYLHGLNRYWSKGYNATQLKSAAQYAIKNRLNMEGDR